VLLLQQIVALPPVSHPVATFALYGVGALAGVLIANTVSEPLRALAGRFAAVTPRLGTAFMVLLSTALLSAIAWSYLWNVPVAGLCALGGYVLCGLVYRTQRWPFGNAVMDGVFCGFLLSLAGVALGLDPVAVV
jgi:hypothetical protein